jgi:hypothetical protein
MLLLACRSGERGIWRTIQEGRSQKPVQVIDGGYTLGAEEDSSEMVTVSRFQISVNTIQGSQ